MIQKLLDTGFAYVGENNDVYYSVSEFKDYGKLSGKTLKDLRVGDRVEIDRNKILLLGSFVSKSFKMGSLF